MSWQDEEAGALNKEPLIIEVADIVYNRLVQTFGPIDAEGAAALGVHTGIVVRETYKLLLKRGLLNELGVKIVKAELQILEAEEVSDHEH